MYVVKFFEGRTYVFFAGSVSTRTAPWLVEQSNLYESWLLATPDRFLVAFESTCSFYKNPATYADTDPPIW